MTLEDRKQLDDILCDEVNVKRLRRPFSLTDGRQKVLVYTRATRSYTVIEDEVH